MARKIHRSVFIGGVNYTPNATDEQMDELEEKLSAEDVKRLEADDDGAILEGFKGKRKAAEPRTYGVGTVLEGPARPQGIEKNAKGEPQRQVLGEDVEQPENTPQGVRQPGWVPTPVGTKAAPGPTKK